MCAVCEKQVDEILRLSRVDTEAEEFRVKCHGEREICILPMGDIIRSGGNISFGRAFTVKRPEHDTLS